MWTYHSRHDEHENGNSEHGSVCGAALGMFGLHDPYGQNEYDRICAYKISCRVKDCISNDFGLVVCSPYSKVCINIDTNLDWKGTTAMSVILDANIDDTHFIRRECHFLVWRVLRS